MVGDQAKNIFFHYNNKNCEKENQIEVTVFRNGASESFLSWANCFYHSNQCFEKPGKGMLHNLHFKWLTLVQWNNYKQAKNVQGKNTQHITL